MEFRQRDGDYEVGYGKPPKKNRFQKGQSGNPNGRRGRGLSYVTLFREELRQKATLKDGRKTKVNKLQLMIQQIIKRAIEGDQASIRLVFEALHLKPEPDESDELSDAGTDDRPKK